MIDSCRPRILDAGFEQMYSMSNVLITSTMKSDPGRPPPTSTSTCEELLASTSRGAAGKFGFAANVAAPTAALFRKSRRAIGSFLDFAMSPPLGGCALDGIAVLEPRTDGLYTLLRVSLKTGN